MGGGTPKTCVSTYWDGDIPWFSVKDVPSENDIFVIYSCYTSGVFQDYWELLVSGWAAVDDLAQYPSTSLGIWFDKSLAHILLLTGEHGASRS